MNKNEEASKNESRSIGSPLDLDLFSYNSASLIQYD